MEMINDKLLKKYNSARAASTEGVFITPIFRLSFPALVEKAGMEGSEKKYEVTMLFPEGTDMSAIQNAAVAAASAKFGATPQGKKYVESLKKMSVPPSGFTTPFRDQGEKALDGYVEGLIFSKARSNRKPQVMALEDGKRRALSDDEVLSMAYAGCWCVASVTVFTFDVTTNKGVSLGLNNLLLIADDAAFGGGGVSAAEEFEDFGELDDDFEV